MNRPLITGLAFSLAVNAAIITGLAHAQTQAPTEQQQSAPTPPPPAPDHGGVKVWIMAGCSDTDYDLFIFFNDGMVSHVTADTAPPLPILQGTIGDVKGFIRHDNCVAAAAKP
jgi:hypothetical protein